MLNRYFIVLLLLAMVFAVRVSCGCLQLNELQMDADGLLNLQTRRQSEEVPSIAAVLKESPPLEETRGWADAPWSKW